MQVKLLDLNRQWESVKEELAPAVMGVFEDSQFVLGGRVADFEAALALHCGVAGGVGVASGTDAILISLRACGVGRGEDVITTPYTFFATAGAIWNVGGRPKFVDIDPDTFNIDPTKIEEALSFTTGVIMPVHLFGQVADMDPITVLAQKHGLCVVEDAAQAIGAEYKGRRAGRFGDLTAFSFFPSKNLGGAGDGGMVVGDDAELVEKVRLLRTHGAMKSYVHEAVGWNSRLDALQAAVLAVKLRHLDDWSAARRAHAAIYDRAFGPMDEVTAPKVMDGCTHIYNQYVIRARARDELKTFLGERGVGSAVYYPLPLHLQACFEALGYEKGDFPESERAARETLSLPVYPELREEEQRYVIEKVKEFYAR